MKRRAILLLLLSALPAADVASVKTTVEGAWLQTGLKWEKAPRKVDPNLRSSEAGVLYLGKDQTFAIIYCYVYRKPPKYEVMSGEGYVLYRGKWQAKGDDISVEYRLEIRTLPKPCESLPGPIQHATLKTPRGLLTFEGKTFHRDEALDESAVEFVYGVK